MVLESIPTVPVKILGGRSVVQFAPLDNASDSNLLAAFSPENVQHLMTQVTEPINSWKTATHTFQANNRGYIDDLLLPLLAQDQWPIVQFRFGLVAGNEAEWRPWERHIILSNQTVVRSDVQSGPLVTIKTVDLLWLAAANNRIKAHRGSASTIMRNLWAELDGGNSVIEETFAAGHSPRTGLWYQANESDFDIMLKVLAATAANKLGVASYRFYVKDDALHFHSPAYKVPYVRKVKYARGEPGFNNLTVEDKYFEDAGLLAPGGLKRLAADPVTGEAVLMEAKDSKLLKLAASSPEFRNFTYQRSHIGPNLASVEEIKAQQTYASQVAEVFTQTLTADKCLDIRVGDVLNIELADETSSHSAHSGLWLVNGAVHTMQEGGLTSSIALSRGELNQTVIRSVMAPGVGFALPNLVGFSFSAMPEVEATGRLNMPGDGGVLVPVISE